MVRGTRLKRSLDQAEGDEFQQVNPMSQDSPKGVRPSTAAPDPLDQQTRRWATALHLSVFAGYLLPLVGWLVPILIWRMKKSALPGIDIHGKIVLNWILSMVLYAVLGIIFSLVVLGVFLLIALGVGAIVFPVVGGIKANRGEAWHYPLSIRFFG